MSELAFLVVGLVIGYFARDMRDRIKWLESFIQTHYLMPPEKNEPKSLIVEPLTPEQQAAKEMRERVTRLNS